MKRAVRNAFDAGFCQSSVPDLANL
ncbi:MAG: hypothetical protein JWO34_915, partial [Arthrobacter sp.]|nr:hypothetical protein [Arthrobacter sp.]